MAQKKIGFTKGSAQADRLILNNGLTATTQISFSGASSLTFSLPQTNGASGQVIVTDGAGNLSFAAAVPGVSGFAFGSAATPSIFFTDDPDTGLFRNGTNQLGFSTNGTQKLLIGTTTIQSDAIHVMSADLRLKNGTIDSPSVRFANDLDTGIYRPGPNTMAMITGGATAAIFGTTTIQSDLSHIMNSDLRIANGTLGVPSLRFTNDTDTGLFRPTGLVNTIGISCGGTSSAQFDSTGILIPAGTLTQPALKFVSDPDTGFYRPRTSGGILINNAIAVACGGLTASMFDTASGANETRLLLFDVTANTLVRVSRGPADSGGTGSRALIIPN